MPNGKTLMQVFDADYVVVNKKPIVRLFGKTETGGTVCAIYDKFFPYFYVQCPEEKFDSVIAELKKERVVEFFDKKSMKRVMQKKSYDIRGEPAERFLPIGFGPQTKLLKVIGKDPSEVPEMREIASKMGHKVFEADILFKYRFMVDNFLKGMNWVEVEGKTISTGTIKCPTIQAESFKPVEILKNAPLKYLALDIETISPEGKAIEMGRDQIIMISLMFSSDYRGKKTQVLIAKNISGQEPDTVCCANEEEMLKKLLDIIKDFDPDFLIGYNINNFDIPYIDGRMRAFNIQRDFSRADKSLISKKGNLGYSNSILGRVIVDPYEIIKRDVYLHFKRYDLGTIGREMLGIEKLDVGGPRGINECWRGGPEGVKKLVTYARRDSELALKLVLEKGLIDKFFEIAKLSGLLLQDCFAGQSQRIECMVLHEFRDRKFVLPPKPDAVESEKRKAEREKHGLKGAIVLEPTVGLHADGCVLVLDFTSLYPSIVRTFNICPTTLLLKDEDLPQNKSPIDAKFVKPEVRQGILPKLLKFLMEARASARKQYKIETNPETRRILDAKQGALKILANSVYGYTGYARARLYVMEVAGSITGYGRENILRTTELIEKNFKTKIVYGDSITKDRFVTIMNRDGIVEIKNIEELFMENKGKTEFARGKQFINLKGYKALTLNPNTRKTEWKLVKQIIRHKTKKKIFRVNQKFGETIATEDHSIITENNGVLGETTPQNMPGRKMIRVRNIPKPKQIKSIDLLEILSKYKNKLIYKRREKISSIREEGGWLTFGWTNRKSPVKIKRIIKSNEDMESLCRLVGAFIAEGSSSTPETTKSKYGASIACSDVKWLEQLKRDYLKIFKNTKASIIKSTKKKRILSYENSHGKKTIEYVDTTHKLQMMNGLSAVFFKMLCGQKSHGKKIPEFVYHIPRKYQKIVLDNMIKGDGSRLFMNMRLGYSEKYKQNNFRYETRSLHLISGLSFLLSLLGQNYTIRFRPAKKTYILTTTTRNNSNTQTKITKENYNGHVYDLNIEGSHMFVDSCGQILLHNTDSLFLKTEINDLDRAQSLGEEIAGFVTKNLPGLELKFEKIFKSFLILTKKRYAGWSFEKDQGKWKIKIDMKGIETVRRDWCGLVGETMNEVLKIILTEQDVKKASAFARQIIKDLQAGKIPVEKLTVVKGISKSIESYGGLNKSGGKISAPAHVQLAKKILARDPSRGSMVGERIPYVIIKGNQMLSLRAEDPDFVKQKGLEIDGSYYIDNQLLPPLERIFEACGIAKAELIEGSRQKSLFELANGKSVSPEQMVLQNFDGVVCKNCAWTFRRPPLVGHCPSCSGTLYFSSNGSMGKFVAVG
ncbi:MAG TPA: DNA polymerase domain-containing protein [archaeon]|nr:DNA polymerase domain-containing protein [archaeon]